MKTNNKEDTNVSKAPSNEGKAGDHPERVEVVVEYVGKQDYSETFPATVSLQDVKVKAMKAFGLELSAQENYVLQFNGVDLDKNAKLNSLHAQRVVLTLALVKEPVKG